MLVSPATFASRTTKHTSTKTVAKLDKDLLQAAVTEEVTEMAVPQGGDGFNFGNKQQIEFCIAIVSKCQVESSCQAFALTRDLLSGFSLDPETTAVVKMKLGGAEGEEVVEAPPPRAKARCPQGTTAASRSPLQAFSGGGFSSSGVSRSFEEQSQKLEVPAFWKALLDFLPEPEIVKERGTRPVMCFEHRAILEIIFEKLKGRLLSGEEMFFPLVKDTRLLRESGLMKLKEHEVTMEEEEYAVEILGEGWRRLVQIAAKATAAVENASHATDL